MSFWIAYKLLRGNYMRVIFPLMGVITAAASLVMTISLATTAERIIDKDLSVIGRNRIILGGRELEHKELDFLEKLPFVEYAMFPEKREINDGKIIRAYGNKALVSMGLPILKENEVVLDKEQFISLKIGESIYLETNLGKKKFIIKDFYEEESPFETTLVGNRVIMESRSFEKSFGKRVYKNLVVSFNKGEDGELYVPFLLRELNKNRYSEDKIKLLETPALHKKIEKIRSFINKSLLILSIISFLVGGIGIINLIGASIRDREEYIGILRSMGISKKGVIKIFLIEGSIIVTLGGVIGVFLGVFFSIVIGLLLNIPLKFEILKILEIFLVIIGSSIFLGLIPAKRAGDLEIVDALKNR